MDESDQLGDESRTGKTEIQEPMSLSELLSECNSSSRNLSIREDDSGSESNSVEEITNLDPDDDMGDDDVNAEDMFVNGYSAQGLGHQKPYALAELADIVFKYRNAEYPLPSLQIVPLRVQKNCVFVINTSKLAGKKDILADDNGVWDQTSGCRQAKKRYTYDEVFGLTEADAETDSFPLFRRSYRNMTCPTFHRVVLEAPEFGLAVIQYYFDGPEISFDPAPHGNKVRSISPFRKKFPSTTEAVKRKIEQGVSAKSIKHSIIADLGGLDNIPAAGQIPDTKSIINHTHSFTKRKRVDDYELLHAKCQRDRDGGMPFIRCIQTAPDFLLVCASERQLNDAARFVTVEGGSILSSDTTFNIGKFYVTLFTIRHMLVQNTRTQSHPVIVVGACLHWTRDSDAFVGAAARLVQERPVSRNTRFLGTDCDKALTKGLLSVFSNSKLVMCQIHVWDNIVRKLGELGMLEFKRAIYYDLFGERTGSARTFALIDQPSPEDFDDALESLLTKWQDFHPKGHEFTSYFKAEKAAVLRDHFNPTIREECGLGVAVYTQNGIESLNASIKADLTKSLTPHEAVIHLEKFGSQQTTDLEMALRSAGDYRLTSAYSHLAINESAFSQMSVQARRAHLDRIHTEPFDPKEAFIITAVQCPFEDRLMKDPTGSILKNLKSIGMEALFNYLVLAKNIRGTKNGGLTTHPTQENLYYVANSPTSKVCVLVELASSTGRVKCDKACRAFRMHGLCEHTLCLVLHLDMVDKYVAWFNGRTNQEKQQHGMQSLISSGAPKGTGSKHRKGSTQRKPPVTSILQRPMGNSSSRASVTCNRTGAAMTGTWDKIRILATATKPCPMPGQYEIWRLQECHGQVKTCSGCYGQFARDRVAPDDLVFVTRGSRSFSNPQTRNTDTRQGNVYLHPNKACVDLYLKKHNVGTSRFEYLMSGDTKASLGADYDKVLKAAVL